jgi:hypothetical protein
MPEGDVVKIIVVSANVAKYNEASRTAEAAWDAFLLKPIDTKALCTLLETLLQIEWLYKSHEAENLPLLHKTEELMNTPSAQELREIYDLAFKGDMAGIQAYAVQLKHRDRRFHAFSTKLHHFAQTYQDEQLLHFIEQYLEEMLE